MYEGNYITLFPKELQIQQNNKEFTLFDIEDIPMKIYIKRIETEEEFRKRVIEKYNEINGKIIEYIYEYKITELENGVCKKNNRPSYCRIYF